MVKKYLSNYTREEIGDAIIAYLYKNRIKNNIPCSPLLSGIIRNSNASLQKEFEENKLSYSYTKVFNYFEELNRSKIKEAVYTPSTISKYMCRNIRDYNSGIRIMDPACGTGIILYTVLKFLTELHDTSPVSIVENSLFGVDLDKLSVKYCKLILEIYCLECGYITKNIRFNIFVGDSLKDDWKSCYGTDKFNYILGNPPYTCVSELSREDRQYYSYNFRAAVSKYTLAHLFVEECMNHLVSGGRLCMVVMGTFFKNKSVDVLCEKFCENNLLREIVEINDSKTFYTANVKATILTIGESKKNTFDYAKVSDFSKVTTIDRVKLPEESVKKKYFATNKSKAIIDAIEHFDCKLGEYICVGAATLADDVFVINDDGKGYVNGKEYDIEPEMIRTGYRAKKRKGFSNYINVICPYKNGEVIKESELLTKYPITYEYLKTNVNKLQKRNKAPIWYAYGRNQGLKDEKRKLVYGTFSNTPRFCIPEDPYTLPLGGYYIKDDIPISAEVLQKMLNSNIMAYYVSHTSCAAAGNSYNYQKSVLKNFSVPLLSKEEEKEFLKMDATESELFLLEKYGIPEECTHEIR